MSFYIAVLLVIMCVCHLLTYLLLDERISLTLSNEVKVPIGLNGQKLLNYEQNLLSHWKSLPGYWIKLTIITPKACRSWCK